MIQIKPVHLPSSEEHPPEITMAPDGILHPRFAMRKPGIGAWVTADQTVFKDLYKRRTYTLRLMSRTISHDRSHGYIIPPLTITYYTPATTARSSGSRALICACLYRGLVRWERRAYGFGRRPSYSRRGKGGCVVERRSTTIQYVGTPQGLGHMER